MSSGRASGVAGACSVAPPNNNEDEDNDDDDAVDTAEAPLEAEEEEEEEEEEEVVEEAEDCARSHRGASAASASAAARPSVTLARMHNRRFGRLLPMPRLPRSGCVLPNVPSEPKTPSRKPHEDRTRIYQRASPANERHPA